VTRIERLEGPGAAAAVEPLLREYVPWVVAELAAALGLTFDDVDAVIEQHHAAFRAELPNLVEGRGRLLVARVDGEPVGVGALKPVDATTAEVKRMFVRPRTKGTASAGPSSSGCSTTPAARATPSSGWRRSRS